eukprot:6189534-Lingulodinium_polyedra.AAC.1
MHLPRLRSALPDGPPNAPRTGRGSRRQRPARPRGEQQPTRRRAACRTRSPAPGPWQTWSACSGPPPRGALR